MAEEKKSSISNDDHFVNDETAVDVDHYELGIDYTPEAPHSLNVQRTISNYKFVPQWYKKHQSILTTLFATEQYQIIQAVHISYRWRFNAVKNANYSIQFIEDVWLTSLIGYKVPIFELYKRFAVKQGKFSSDAAKRIDFRNVNKTEIARFKGWLQEHAEIFDPMNETKRVRLFSIGCDDNEVEYLKLIPSKVTKLIVQLNNSLGMVMEKMNEPFKRFINVQRKHNKYSNNKFFFG